MKTKTIKARKMWANYYREGFIFLESNRGVCKDNATSDCCHRAVPVAVIPLDDVEALVHCAYEASRLPGEDGLTQMRAALTAIGVLPHKGGRK